MPRLLRRTDWDENINTIRARVGMPTLVPPNRATRHWDTPADATFAAIATAISGVCDAWEDPNPRMIAARAINAVAVAAAVSTSHSYLAFVAAATAAESIALLEVEYERGDVPEDLHEERIDNAIYAAADTAMEAAASSTATHYKPS